jgi:hypothetical protein
MDAVKEYWKNPVFLIGVFLIVVGGFVAIAGEHHAGVWTELAGFAIITISIYLINSNSSEETH